MSGEKEKSIITKTDQARIDNAVKLGATKQVQLIRYIYETMGPQGITDFVRKAIEPWARAWARKIMDRHGLTSDKITAKIAIQQLYPEVHDHTAICSDHLDMFFSIDHDDLQECGAKYCPVAAQWMEIWPEGAHHLCYVYSYSFDKYFFEELNSNLIFTKHAECCADQPGIPHGKRCLMRLETKGKPVDPKKVFVIEDPNKVNVSPQIESFLAGKTIKYVPHIPG
ncbi:MAG: L-2-amino-thiazoline-4-carboxylic acid hydrolase [Myxococcota bacterium]|jgi:hypothetical protein|nr:L-2-amino-thiazoline-4-carboxylic acid hydrolase [Myxococcota bacterium]